MPAPGPAVQIKYNEIEVNNSFEKALKDFKYLIQDEKIMGQLKERKHYEKPSIKKRRKRREAEKRRITTFMREKMIESGEWEKRKKKRELKKVEKLERKIRRQELSD